MCFVPIVGPDDNIYLGIEQPFLQPPSDEEIRLELRGLLSQGVLQGIDPLFNRISMAVVDIYERTFWANAGGLAVHWSMYSLARRGLNCDMITFYKGPGGVGCRSYQVT